MIIRREIYFILPPNLVSFPLFPLRDYTKYLLWSNTAIYQLYSFPSCSFYSPVWSTYMVLKQLHSERKSGLIKDKLILGGQDTCRYNVTRFLNLFSMSVKNSSVSYKISATAIALKLYETKCKWAHILYLCFYFILLIYLCQL